MFGKKEKITEKPKHPEPKDQRRIDRLNRYKTHTVGKSLTVQAPKDDCDINCIIAKYVKTGVLPHSNPQEPFYGDFSETPDYENSLRVVSEAQTAFQRLPANIRAGFGNDPLNMITWLEDATNYETAAELGLLDPEKVKSYFDSKKQSIKEAQNTEEKKIQQAVEKIVNKDSAAHKKS